MEHQKSELGSVNWLDSKKVEAAISSTKSVEQRVLDALGRIECLLERVVENTTKHRGGGPR